MITTPDVLLLAHTPDPALVCASAANLCYSNSDILKIFDKMKASPEKVDELLDKIMKSGHHSVLEHASFTFGIQGISRACSHQLVRHRIASFSQQSQRYVEAKADFALLVPQTIQDKPELMAKFIAKCAEIGILYSEMTEAGIPAEDARFLLPNATETKLIMTMNARELLYFFSLRCCNRAQWEAREIAIRMFLACFAVSPQIFKYAGPGCLVDGCPEGNMGCGLPADYRLNRAA